MNKQDTEDRKYVGARITRLRESVNWTPAELCRRTGLDPAHLSRIERGERGISAIMYVRVEDIVWNELLERRRRADFRDERSRACYNIVVDALSNQMTQDGLSDARVDGVCESVVGIIKSAYAPDRKS